MMTEVNEIPMMMRIVRATMPAMFKTISFLMVSRDMASRMFPTSAPSKRIFESLTMKSGDPS